MVALLKAPKVLQLLATFAWVFYGSVLVENCPRAAGSSNFSCIEKERQALLKFRRGLVIDSGNHLSNWTTDNMDCCRWEGVGCSRAGHVVRLVVGGLFSCGGERGYCLPVVKGEIGPSLLDLPYLNYLDLSQNGFTRIPAFIGSLKSLKYLDLSGNSFVGTIPHQIGNLSALESLDLSNNFVLKVDSSIWISRLSSLKFLNMEAVRWDPTTNWVQPIAMIPSLTQLYLVGCNLSLHAAPANVNSSRSLEVLDLRWNFLNVAALSPWLNNSAKLVDVSINSLDSPQGPIPDYIFNLISIQHLDLSFSYFEGEISKAMSNLTNLLTLDLSRNVLKESISFFQSGSNSLRELHLDQNNISGSLPDLSKFPSLEELTVAGNRFGGSLEQLLQQSSSLTVLDFSSNLFDGVLVEDQFLNLSKLEVLSLSSNSLTLNFSAWWAAPFQLQALYLSDCKLGPSFPNWLNTQKNLTVLDISNSGISDVVPRWFWNITFRLQYLNLSHNNIGGTLQNSLPFPRYIDLSFNLFHGPLPSLISVAAMLNLSNNKFSGNISFLCNLRSSSIDLSNNNFSGSLPTCLERNLALTLLNLNNNNISGHIPRSIGNLSSIRILGLRNNSLTGVLPTNLKNCQDLVLLDLGQNQLTGKIPSWIGTSLTNLVALSLKSNKFGDKMPSTLCHLKFIQILDFSLNNIFGAIPSCLNNITTMAAKSSPHYSSVYMFGLGLGHLDLFWDVVFTALVAWKGMNHEFESEKNLKLLKLIDLSSNRLSGPIPKELTSLYELVSLNLSSNNLSGAIPNKIGELKMLDSLDLSFNLLSGEIPWSMTNFSTLGYLNLSYNNLSGRIPTSTQTQRFTASELMGNPGLCGPPLTNPCSGNEIEHDTPITDVNWDHDNNEDGWFQENVGLCVSILLGFIVGFWGVCVTLVLKSSWRKKYFQILNLNQF